MKAMIAFIWTLFLLAGSFLSAQNQTIRQLTLAYYGIQQALVSDDGAAASEQAVLFLESKDAVSLLGLNAAQQKAWRTQAPKLTATGQAISQTTDLAKQRAQLNELSLALLAVLQTFPDQGEKVYLQYCPMQKAHWLSQEKDINNPYYGAKMRTCGSVKEILN